MKFADKAKEITPPFANCEPKAPEEPTSQIPKIVLIPSKPKEKEELL